MIRAVFVGFALFSAASCFAQVHSVARSNGGGYHSGYSGRPYRRGYVYAYPVYVGGYAGYYGDYSSGYGPGYAPGYAPDPGYQQGPPPAAPPVIINQYFGGPPATGDPQAYAQQPQDDGSIRLYQQQPSYPQQQPSYPQQQGPEQAASDARTYLIAYKDHSVYTALAYWIEGQTLHYITAGNTHNQTDLSLIDIEFTKKLNADRSMPFNVPASQ